MCVFVCESLCAYSHMSPSAYRDHKYLESSGAEVERGCGLPDMGVWDQVQVLCKSFKNS